MSNEKPSLPLGRRAFLKRSCAALGGAAMGHMLGRMDLMRSAMAQVTATSPYKALVCVFLAGGNDSNNLLVPRSGQPRVDYDAGRGVLALAPEVLHPLNLTSPVDLGVHPSAAGLARLSTSGRLAFGANVGPLAFPMPNRSDYTDGIIPRPINLFSHSDQQRHWQTALPDRPLTSGWGGRAAELLHDTHNATSNLSMLVSLNGRNTFMVTPSGALAQYAINPGGTASLNGYGGSYSGAVNADGSYRTTSQGRRLRALDTAMLHASGHLLEDAYSDVYLRARTAEGNVRAALDATAAAEAAGGFSLDAIFTARGATSKLADQLKHTARLIGGREILGNNRQLFFVQQGGYDTHQTQLDAHATLVGDLSAALEAFDDALGALGVRDAVTAFTASDFNRTFTPNGTDASAGSDHAWGGHAMVLGGAVQGGQLYGTFPELVVGAVRDASNNRGRWIPTTAVDQYLVPLVRWLGADSAAVEAILPNLHRFDDPAAVASANLGFLG